MLLNTEDWFSHQRCNLEEIEKPLSSASNRLETSLIIDSTEELILLCQNKVNTYRNWLRQKKKKIDESDLCPIVAERTIDTTHWAMTLSHHKEETVEINLTEGSSFLQGTWNDHIWNKQQENFQRLTNRLRLGKIVRTHRTDLLEREQFTMIARLASETSELIAEEDNARSSHGICVIDRELVKSIVYFLFTHQWTNYCKFCHD